MTVGIQPSKDTIDALLTGTASTLRREWLNLDALNTFLRPGGVWLTDEQFNALGYAGTDIDTIKAVVGDFDSLRRVANGLAASGVYNFMANAGQVDPLHLV